MSIATAYGTGKRAAEFLCALAAAERLVPAVVARIFTVAGPGIPASRGFALSQFIAMASKGGPISLNSDGRAVRTYLYAADLVNWLWTLLLEGTPGRAYNVGGEQPWTIREVAELVAGMFSPMPEVHVRESDLEKQAVSYMVPDVSRATGELGLHAHIELPDAVKRIMGCP
jgi:dTDP-glucose 4,6-dehydratase